MESWLPYVHPQEDLLPDLLPPGSQVVLVEPRRIRDRAVQLLDEEAALAETLALTWGVADGAHDAFPRLHLPFDRLLQDSKAGVLALPPAPEGPGTQAMTVRGFSPGRRRPGPAGGPGDAARRGGLRGDPVRGHDRRGRRALSTVLAEEGVHAPVVDERGRAPGAFVVTAPLSSGFILPDCKVAVLSESDITGRRLPHRRARPARPRHRRLLRRPGRRELRGPPPARGGPVRRGHLADDGRDDP